MLLEQGEPTTVREARLAIRDLEAEIERVHMSPAMALGGFDPGWYLYKARLALRQAERALAKTDDPRLEPLKPLRPQVAERRPQERPKRKRYRCPGCFREGLYSDGGDPHCRRCDRDLEPVVRMQSGRRDH